MAWYSQTWTWVDGAWHEGNPPLMGPRTHAAWLGSMVFDGARVFEGTMPDMDRHCARVNRSGRRYASVHVEAWQDNRSRLFAQGTGHFLMPEAG